MTIAQTLIFDPFGRLLADIEPEWQYLNWRLNGTGLAKFTLNWDVSPSTIQFGNRILVQFDNGLPDWGGVIDVPRRVQQGLITVTAYTGERILDWRVTAKGRYFTEQAPGTIAQGLLEDENEEHPTGVTVGTILTTATNRTLEYHYHDLLARLKDLVRLTGEEFAVLPAYSGGRLSFALYWYPRRGTDKTGSVWLLDGANVSEATLDQQGPLHNRVILVGDGDTWGAQRLDSIAEDVASQAAYGYREYSEVQQGVSQDTTLDANAAAMLANVAAPQNIVTIMATNATPGTFASYDIGDIVTAKLFPDSTAWYFDEPVRIVAREWQPGGTCRLEVSQWQGS